jgi:signal peptidase I
MRTPLNPRRPASYHPLGTPQELLDDVSLPRGGTSPATIGARRTVPKALAAKARSGQPVARATVTSPLLFPTSRASPLSSRSSQCLRHRRRSGDQGGPGAWHARSVKHMAPRAVGTSMTSSYPENGNPRPSSHRRPSSRVSLVKRVVTAVEAVALGAVLALAGIAGVALARGTWMMTSVQSGSMRPGLSVGGLAISERTPVDRLAVRDVIVFRSPDNPSEQVLHRIIHLAEGSSGQMLVNTQGDANTVRDPWTITIRGGSAYRVRWSVPLVGYVAIAYQNYRDFWLGAGIVMAGVAMSIVYSVRRHDKRRRTGTKPKAPTAPRAASASANEAIIDLREPKHHLTPIPDNARRTPRHSASGRSSGVFSRRPATVGLHRRGP